MILSSAVLSPGLFSGPVDWVVAAEFAPILRGHPGIGRLWEFDRSAGLSGWLKLCAELSDQDYGAVLDLHGSLRTCLARLYFLLQRRARPVWRGLPKTRWRLYGLHLFKKKWPKAWLPKTLLRRFAEFANPGSEAGRPDLTYLLLKPEARETFRVITQATAAAGKSSYYCVMPGSKWAGKCWPAESFLEVCRTVHSAKKCVVVLGGARDPGSQKLVELLAKAGIAHVSGVGKWDLTQVAGVLAGADAYLGNDTGLAHLAEALGVPALVIFGPTSPEMGFGPWRAQSRAVGLAALGCRPCGKDGRRCYRPKQKYLCMTGLTAAEVSEQFKRMGEKTP